MRSASVEDSLPELMFDYHLRGLDIYNKSEC